MPFTVAYEDNLIRMTFLSRKSWKFTKFWCLFWLLLHKEWLKIQARELAENEVRFSVPSHSSLTFVSLKGDYYAVAVDSKDLYPFSVRIAHMCQVHSHTRGWKRDCRSHSSRRAGSRKSTPSGSFCQAPTAVLHAEDMWAPSKRWAFFGQHLQISWRPEIRSLQILPKILRQHKHHLTALW